MNTRNTLVYAGLAALIAALAQAAQIAVSLSTNPVTEPSKWAISAVAGVFSAAALAAIPWIRAQIPTPPAP